MEQSTHEIWVKEWSKIIQDCYCVCTGHMENT